MPSTLQVLTTAQVSLHYAVLHVYARKSGHSTPAGHTVVINFYSYDVLTNSTQLLNVIIVVC